MDVVILGSGPAGLMAAQAVADAHTDNMDGDLRLSIFSRKRVSSMYGAQYLHKPIPGVTKSDPRRIDYRIDGTVDGYRRKVYGAMWDGTVSPEDFTDPHDGWDIRETYAALVDTWWWLVNDVILDATQVHSIINAGPDLVINTVPLESLCYRGHTFGYTEVIAAGDAPDMGISIPYPCPEDTVICNGDPLTSWYRLSRVFEHTTVEWPLSIGKPPVNTAAVVRKPTYHACDCWTDKLFCVGRYGSWQKGVLSHEAYFDTYTKIRTMTLKGDR